MSGSSVFVTIDDAGLCRAVNEAIRRCLEAGAVDCVSILATGPHAEEACSQAMGSGLAISAHLNCVEPPFLGPWIFPPPMLLAFGSQRWAARLEAEWRAQIESLLSLGALVTGLDSHRHIHHVPWIAEIILRLAAEYRAGAVRAAVLPDRFLRPEGVLLDMLARRLRRRAGLLGIRTREGVAGFGRSGGITRGYLEALKLPIGETELVMHPATSAIWSAGQPGELELMISEWFRSWKKQHSA